jgi:hypothetical protein
MEGGEVTMHINVGLFFAFFSNVMRGTLGAKSIVFLCKVVVEVRGIDEDGVIFYALIGGIPLSYA